jgi:hypothetical protein
MAWTRDGVDVRRRAPGTDKLTAALDTGRGASRVCRRIAWCGRTSRIDAVL